MIIDKNGLTLDELQDVLVEIENNLKAKYGESFYIKSTGVIDNMMSAVGFQIMSLEEQIAFLVKQFDPEQAEDEFQDALYERILCYRNPATKTIFARAINGVGGVDVTAGSVTIRNEATLDEFVNKDDFTIGDDGKVVADFECVLFGAIDVPDNAELVILTAPLGVNRVTFDESLDLRNDIGQERETNADFRAKYRNQKNINAKATRQANYSNLYKYVDDESFLKIFDKKTDIDMNAGEIKIISNHNTTNNIFGDAIFNTVADGIDTIGTTQVTVKDISDEDIVVKWINADFVEIAISASVKKKEGYFINTVIANVKKSIMDYVDKNIYGLGQTVYANTFFIPMLQADGVETIEDLVISIEGELTTTNQINLEITELAMFSENWINLDEIV